MKKLDVPDAPNDVIDFLVTIGPFLDHIIVYFQRKHNAKEKMEPKWNERLKEWNLVNESDQCTEQLEEKLHQENKVVVALDSKIIGWKKEIEAL